MSDASHDSHAELVGRLRARCHEQEKVIAGLRRQLEEATHE